MNQKPDRHTPGPWRVNEDSGQIGDVWAVCPDEPVAQAQICGTLRFPDHERRKANARLIAAAPRLLAACRLALTLVQDNWPYEHGDPQVGQTWGELEAVITEATGGKP